MLLPFSQFPGQMNAPRTVLASAATNGEKQQFKRRGTAPPQSGYLLERGTVRVQMADAQQVEELEPDVSRNIFPYNWQEFPLSITLRDFEEDGFLMSSLQIPACGEHGENLSTPAPYCSFPERTRITGIRPSLSALQLALQLGSSFSHSSECHP